MSQKGLSFPTSRPLTDSETPERGLTQFLHMEGLENPVTNYKDKRELKKDKDKSMLLFCLSFSFFKKLSPDAINISFI